MMELQTVNEPRCVIVSFGSSCHSAIELMKPQNTNNIEFIRVDEDTTQAEDKLQYADVVFVTGGLDEQKGDAIAPFIAKIAKEAGALSIGIVATSFEYLQELKKESDCVIVIPKEISESLNIVDIFEGITGIILTRNENEISLDWADLAAVLSHKGIAKAGIGVHQGKKAAYYAINKAKSLASNNDMPIKNASGILVHFTMHPDFYFMELSEAMDLIHNSVEESADVVFGTTIDETLPLDFIRVVLVATGFEKRHLVPVNNIF